MGTNTIAVRAYSVDLAQAVGEKPAMFIHQLNYWLDRPKMGYMIDGQRCIKNTYEAWTSKENFPHWTVKTVQRVVEKLKEIGLVVTKQKSGSYDRTLHYTLNRSNPLLVKCGYFSAESNPSGQKRVVESGQKRDDRKRQNVQMNNTQRIPQRKQQSLRTESKTAVSKSSTKPKSRASTRVSYRSYYKTANSWLRKKESDFKKAARAYVDKHCNKPNVSYPKALHQKIIVEIWRKYTGQYTITDFEYVDRSYLEKIKCPDIQPAPVVYQSTIEDDMMRLYQSGGLYG